MTAYMQQPKRAHALQKWRGIALRAWPMRNKQYPQRITPAEALRLLPTVRPRDLKTAAVLCDTYDANVSQNGSSGGYGDLLELVALAYVTGRAQGVHDERARRQA